MGPLFFPEGHQSPYSNTSIEEEAWSPDSSLYTYALDPHQHAIARDSVRCLPLVSTKNMMNFLHHQPQFINDNSGPPPDYWATPYNTDCSRVYLASFNPYYEDIMHSFGTVAVNVKSRYSALSMLFLI